MCWKKKNRKACSNFPVLTLYSFIKLFFLIFLQARWTAIDKVKKYDLCLQTALMSKSHLADSLSKKELQARSSAILDLGNTLINKQKKAAKLDTKYQKIRAEKIKLKNSINLVNMIRLNIFWWWCILKQHEKVINSLSHGARVNARVDASCTVPSICQWIKFKTRANINSFWRVSKWRFGGNK